MNLRGKIGNFANLASTIKKPTSDTTPNTSKLMTVAPDQANVEPPPEMGMSRKTVVADESNTPP